MGLALAGVLWASSMVVAAIVSAVLTYVNALPCLSVCRLSHHQRASFRSTQFGWRASRVQLHMRSALVTAVSRRTLMLRSSELQAYSSGAVTNMMSVDVQKVQGKAHAE